MPVWLQNLQSRVVFNSHLLKLHCGFLLHVLGVGRWDVSVVCVGREEIRNLNRSYRNVDSPTDVLSFPYHEVCYPAWQSVLHEIQYQTRWRSPGGEGLYKTYHTGLHYTCSASLC